MSLIKKEKKYILTYFILYILNFGYFASLWPFLTNFLLYRQLSASKIGLFFSLLTFVSILGNYFIGYISDKFRSFSKTIILQMIITLFAISFGFNIEYANILILCFLIAGFFNLPIESIIDTWALELNPKLSRYYGVMRAGGSVGFALVTVVTGYLIANISMSFLFINSTLLIIVFIAAIYTIKKKHILADFHSHPTHNEKINILDLIHIKEYVFLFIITTSIQIPSIIITTFLPLIIQNVGGNSSHQGLMLGLGAILELPFFFMTPILLKKYRPKTLISISSVFLLLKVLVLVFAKTPELLVLSSVFAPGYFALFFSSLKYRVSKIAPNHLKTSAQTGIAIAFSGVSGITAGILGGQLIDRLGLSITMYIVLFMVSFASISTIIYSLKSKNL